MRRARPGGLILLCVLLLASSSQAFDGEQPIWVIGGGIGFSPHVYWDWHNTIFADDGPGIAGNFFFGYAPDEKNMVVFEVGGSEITKQILGGENPTSIFFGPTWYHYFKKSRGFFSLVGVGVQINIHDSVASLGSGYLIGGGYEFYPKWQVALYGNWSKASACGFKYDESGGRERVIDNVHCRQIYFVVSRVFYFTQ